MSIINKPISKSIFKSVHNPLKVPPALLGGSPAIDPNNWQLSNPPTAPSIPGITVRALWSVPYGTPTMLKDAVGNFDLTASAPMVLSQDTPSGRSCIAVDSNLNLSNSSLTATSTGICAFFQALDTDQGYTVFGFGPTIDASFRGQLSTNTLLSRFNLIGGGVPSTFTPDAQWFSGLWASTAAGTVMFANNNGRLYNEQINAGTRTGLNLLQVFTEGPFRGRFFGAIAFEITDTSFNNTTNVARKLTRYWFEQASVKPPTPMRKLLAITGNSISVGAALIYQDTPPKQIENRLPGWNVYSVGFPASQTVFHIQGDAEFVDPFYSATGERNVVVMIGEPGNQIVFGATGATALASMTTWGTARKAAGFETIIGTLFDRIDFNASSNPQKDIYNAAIRADFNVPTSSPFVFAAAPGVTYADRMVDLHAINPTKYDGIHPDSVGAENISREIAIAVDGWQATLAPLFSSPSKRFNVDQSITITCGTPGASIYYTLDGSVPTAASTLYTGPIAVTSTTTIRAIAIAAGFPNSPVVDRFYTKVGVQVIAPNWQVSSGTPTITGNNVAFSAGSQNVFSPVLIDSTEDFSVVASANQLSNRSVAVAIDTDVVAVNWGQTDPFVIGFFLNTFPTSPFNPFLEALEKGNQIAPTPGNVGSGWTWSTPILIRMRKVDEDAYLDTSLDAGVTWVNRWIRPRAFRNITTARLKIRSIQVGNMTAWIETLVPAT